jgi:patatin-like phospholipase/acyl hydrolase
MKTSSKTKLKVENIIKKNSGKGLFESNNLFAKTFLLNILKEQEQLPAPQEKQSPENFTPEKNQQDFQNSLEPRTSEKQFDVDGISIEVHIENIKKIKEFSDKLDEFASYLNDPHSTESLHKILSDNDKPGSLLRGITRKTSDGITRVAGEIEKLKEVLNSFIILAPKKLRDTEQVSMANS